MTAHHDAVCNDDRTAGVVRAGEVLAGKYRVQRVLGAGGMGVVLEAVHLRTRERVALKLLTKKDLRSRDRSSRGASLSFRLRGEHIVRVFDVGELDDGTPFTAMELVEGRSLEELLRERGPLTVAGAADCLLQACYALAEVHANGLVHRDVKSSNLLLTERFDGTRLLKLGDFDLLKRAPRAVDGGRNAGELVRTEDPACTEPHEVFGTPEYMSPEQLEGSYGVDARGDVWSLGVVLYEMLAGAPPFEGKGVSNMLLAIRGAPPRRMGDVRADVPGELERVLMGCLRVEASRRPTLVELARAGAAWAPATSRVLVDRIAGASARGARPGWGRLRRIWGHLSGIVTGG